MVNFLNKDNMKYTDEIIWTKDTVKVVDGVEKTLWKGVMDSKIAHSYPIFMISVGDKIENWFMPKEFKRTLVNNAFISKMLTSFKEMIENQ